MNKKDVRVKNEKNQAVNRILAAITRQDVVVGSAKILLYGTATAAIYAIAYGNPLIAVSVSPILARLIETVGSNTLSSIIDRVADDKKGELSPEKITELVENAFAKISPSDYLTESDFYRAIRILETKNTDRHLILKNEFINQNQQLEELHKTLNVFINKIGEGIKSNNSIPAISPMPPRNFVGRREIIEEIKSIFKSYRGGIVQIYGIGGSGRTALAQQIAYEVSPDYPGGVFWGILETEFALKATLHSWGQLCGQNLAPDLDIPSLATILRGLFEKRLQNEGRFLIVINGDYLTDTETELLLSRILPRDIPVLITSRAMRFSHGARIVDYYFQLPLLSEDESLLLFRLYAGNSIIDSDKETTIKLLGFLQGVPLGIVIVGSQIGRLSQKPGFQIKSFVDNFISKGGNQGWYYENGISIAFSISYELLSEKEQKIFRWISVFQLESIKINIVASLMDWSLPETESALDNLVFSNLASWSEIPGEYRLHPFVRSYASHLLEKLGESEIARKKYHSIQEMQNQ